MSRAPLTPWEEVEAYAYGKPSRLQPEMLKRLTRFYKLVLGGEYVIRDEDQKLVPLELNLTQYILLAACMRQASEYKPIRLSVFKSRKVGVSTFIEVLCAYLAAWYEQQRVKLVAHRDKSTLEIFEIATRAARHHPQRPCEPKGLICRWVDVDSSYVGETAGGTAVSAGGTPNIMHLSEVAKWERNKAETWYNCLNAVPHASTTSAIFIESTAKGRELFYSHWEASRASGSEYEAIFIPWYYDDRCQVPFDGELALDDEERLLRRRAAAEGLRLTMGMFQWRRNKIAEIGPDAFRQEYPSTPEEAVQASAGLILPHMRDCVVDELPWDLSLVPPSSLVGGIDFGYADPTVIWTGIYQGGLLGLAQFYRREEGLASDHLAGLVEGATYYCDPSSVSDRQQLAEAAALAGLHVRLVPAPRRKRPGEDIGETEMKALVEFIRAGRLQVLNEVSEQLLIESDTLAWNERTGRIDDRRGGDWGHFDSIYALKYLVLGVDGLTAYDLPSGPRSLSRREQLARL